MAHEFTNHDNAVTVSWREDLSVSFDGLAERICWTRMQTEAGEQLVRIVQRKDLERRAGDGVFFWGVGNAPSRAMPRLLQECSTIDVVFSLMKSRPKRQDVKPLQILSWRQYVDVDGTVKPLPSHVLVTSRAGRRNYHYALICYLEKSLAVADQGPFDPRAYRNVGGGAVGASQVTALLERDGPDGNAEYRIAMRARLTLGSWVKLVDPVEVSEIGRRKIEEEAPDVDSWLKVVKYLRSASRSLSIRLPQPTLFEI